MGPDEESILLVFPARRAVASFSWWAARAFPYTVHVIYNAPYRSSGGALYKPRAQGARRGISRAGIYFRTRLEARELPCDPPKVAALTPKCLEEAQVGVAERGWVVADLG